LPVPLQLRHIGSTIGMGFAGGKVLKNRPAGYHRHLVPQTGEVDAVLHLRTLGQAAEESRAHQTVQTG